MNDHNNSIKPENAMATTTMTMIQALRSAMDVMLERDDNVVTVSYTHLTLPTTF